MEFIIAGIIVYIILDAVGFYVLQKKLFQKIRSLKFNLYEMLAKNYYEKKAIDNYISVVLQEIDQLKAEEVKKEESEEAAVTNFKDFDGVISFDYKGKGYTIDIKTEIDKQILIDRVSQLENKLYKMRDYSEIRLINTTLQNQVGTQNNIINKLKQEIDRLQDSLQKLELINQKHYNDAKAKEVKLKEYLLNLKKQKAGLRKQVKRKRAKK